MPQSYLSTLTARVVWSPPDSERDRPIMGALIGDSATLIVETGASPAHAVQFRRALAELGGSAPNFAVPRFAAVTHWHWDHVFGTDTMDLPTIGHVETRRRVLEMARLDWRDNALNARVAAGQESPFIADHVKIELTNVERGALVITAPDLTFSDEVEVHLGGLTAQIFHVDCDHSPDSSVIFCPEERVAFLGDCFYNGSSEGRYYYTPKRLFPLLDRLEALQADFYIMSHDPAPIPRARVLKDMNMLRAIGAEVERTGSDREAILARLPGILGEPLTEDHAFYVDSLLVGRINS